MATPLKVGLAGLGTVGASVVRLIDRQRAALTLSCGRPVEIVAVTARSKAKNRGVDLKRFRWVKDPITLARDPGIDVFVELIGGAGDPAKRAVETALAAGKSVVTANKALLAKHGVALARLAERHHVALNFEAAVAGGIPIVKTLREGLVGNKLARIYGILNGTCNYILTRMEQRRTVVRRLPRRRAAARLRRGRSDLRHRRPRHGAEALDPRQPRLRHQGRSRRDLCRGHFVDRAGGSAAGPTSSVTASSCSASRSIPARASSSACIRPWCARTPPSPR